jgi:hypothetical protein
MAPQHSASLDELLDCAQGYAEFAMRKIGHVLPALLAESPVGSIIHFIPDNLKDERAKNNFANAARLICIGYNVTSAVLVLEAWMKIAKPGEKLDRTEPPSEAFAHWQRRDRETTQSVPGTPALGHAAPVLRPEGERSHHGRFQ